MDPTLPSPLPCYGPLIDQLRGYKDDDGGASTVMVLKVRAMLLLLLLLLILLLLSLFVLTSQP